MKKIDFLDIPPLTQAGGTVVLPGSKSISNRVLLLAALCEERTTLHGVLDSDDTRVMLQALRILGCHIERDPDCSTTLNLTGMGMGAQGNSAQSSTELFLGNAGTAMRPLLAVLALRGGDYTLSGVPRMHERPIADLVEALQQVGASIEYLAVPGYPPLRVRPSEIAVTGPIRIRGDVSSQFLTAMLMALPLLASDADVSIEVVGELISKPYIDITLKMMAQFGVQVQRQNWQRFTVAKASRYRSPGALHIEADASSASYFIALGAIASAQGVCIKGVGTQSIQGDIRFIEAARLMGADIEGQAHSIVSRRGAWPLRPIDLDCNHIPDAAMTLAVMALFADGTTHLRNIASWRVKETDRIAAMATELRKLGAVVEESADSISITPPTQWRAASIHTYDDHRMAMCFSLVGFNPAKKGVRIEDPACTAKTFPAYFDDFFALAQAQVGDIPVITIDGPSASGKGTLAAELAVRLGYHFLDSGALYRVCGLLAQRQNMAIAGETEADLADLAHKLIQNYCLDFEEGSIWIVWQGERENITQAIRAESVGVAASQLSVFPKVRAALLGLQRSFRRLPGLVADGRDMGSVVFPDARLKIFLTASVQARAQRRYAQIIARGQSAIMEDLLRDLQERDARDLSRSSAPLVAPQDALVLDNSEFTVEESLNWVLSQWAQVSV